MSEDVVKRLAATIAARRTAPLDASYTRELLDAGVERCARKFGEEAIETVIAAMASDPAHMVSETADLIYHLLVLLEVRKIAWDDVASALAGRMGTSGLAEKVARGQKGG